MLCTTSEKSYQYCYILPLVPLFSLFLCMLQAENKNVHLVLYTRTIYKPHIVQRNHHHPFSNNNWIHIFKQAMEKLIFSLLHNFELFVNLLAVNIFITNLMAKTFHQAFTKPRCLNEYMLKLGKRCRISILTDFLSPKCDLG